jgi:alpha-L-rhamnosidase
MNLATSFMSARSGRLFLLLFASLFIGFRAMSSSLHPVSLRCEFLSNPLGIDNTHPRLSWILEGQGRSLRQTAFRILVASTAENLAADNGDLWDSGKVPGNRTTGVRYAGAALHSGMKCYWKVRAWDRRRVAGSWSESASWSMGLLSATEWEGEWIGYDAPRKNEHGVPFSGATWIKCAKDTDAVDATCSRYFARIVTVPGGKQVTYARLFIAADDRFVLYANGKKIGASSDSVENKVTPMQFDFIDVLHPGDNVLLAEVQNLAPGTTGLVAWLRVEFSDQTDSTIVSDQKWRATDKPGDAWWSRTREDLKWPLARVITNFGNPPWRTLDERMTVVPPPRCFRKDFEVEKPIKQAMLYVSALGLIDAHINGQGVADEFFTPGWTDYTRRVYYRTYDVGGLVHKGKNLLSVVLADGWYSGYIGWGMFRDHYGKKTRFLLQLDLEHPDGSHTIVASNPTWRATTGPTRCADFLVGEEYDARLAARGGDLLPDASTSWEQVDVGREVHPILQAHPAPPVRVVGEFRPVAINEPAKGVFVFNLGQNIAGVVRLRVKGTRGQGITLRYAERLNPDGSLYMTNLRSARATDQYTCQGDGEETWQPRFTFHGFQYVEVTGLSGKPDASAITGLALSSDTSPVGSFSCSDSMINQLARNTFWTQRANFIDIPTDCPQRDERLGWTGDAQVYIRAATQHADVQAFFHKWIVDLVDAQRKDGEFPMVAPLKVAGDDGGPAWADAGVICPWTVYQVYGDRDILAQHYDAMKRFIEFTRQRSTPEMLPPAKFHCFGDWLNIDAATPHEVIYTAYFAKCTDIVRQAAGLLGKKTDARKYGALFNTIKRSFNRAFVDSTGKVKGNTQTGYVLALAANLLDGTKRLRAAQHLVDDIQARGWHLSTGFVGTKDLMLILSAIGRDDIAYRLLLNQTFPSWGYTIKNGATSIWERWDGWTVEKGFQDPGMNSFAHYSFGAVYQWMVENMAGIRSDGPGYRRVVIAPKPTPSIGWAKCGYTSVNGNITSAWRVESAPAKQSGEKRFLLTCEVPPNVEALVYLPATGRKGVTESGKPLSASRDIRVVRADKKQVVLEVGSGTYEFACPITLPDERAR